MDNKSYEQFLVMQYTIDEIRQDSDEKTNKYDYKLDKIMAMIKYMMEQNQNYNNHQEIWINQRPRILSLWSWITRRLHHWKVKIIQKFIAWELSK